MLVYSDLVSMVTAFLIISLQNVIWFMIHLALLFSFPISISVIVLLILYNKNFMVKSINVQVAI